MPKINQSAGTQRINRYFKSLQSVKQFHQVGCESIAFSQLFDMDVHELEFLLVSVRKIKNMKKKYETIVEDDRYSEQELQLLQRKRSVFAPAAVEPVAVEPVEPAEPVAVAVEVEVPVIEPVPVIEVEPVEPKPKSKPKRGSTHRARLKAKTLNKPKVNKSLWNYNNTDPTPLYDELMGRTSADREIRHSVMRKAKYIYENLPATTTYSYDPSTFDFKQALLFVAKLAKKYKLSVDLYSSKGLTTAVELIDTSLAKHKKYEKIKTKLTASEALIAKQWKMYDL